MLNLIPKAKSKQSILISKDTLLEYGCSIREAKILFSYISRTCSVVTKQTEKIFSRNSKAYTALVFLYFVELDELKRCAESMILRGSENRTSKIKWSRILNLANIIESAEKDKEKAIDAEDELTEEGDEFEKNK